MPEGDKYSFNLKETFRSAHQEFYGNEPDFTNWAKVCSCITYSLHCTCLIRILALHAYVYDIC